MVSSGKSDPREKCCGQSDLVMPQTQLPSPSSDSIVPGDMRAGNAFHPPVNERWWVKQNRKSAGRPEIPRISGLRSLSIAR
jgi:hypothetical protein